MNRRKLLSLAPALAATVASQSWAAESQPAASTPKPAKYAFPITVQTWSFHRFTLVEAIAKTAATGGDLELHIGQKIGGKLGDKAFNYDLTGAELDELKAQMAKHQVRAYNFGVTKISAHEAEARKVFDFAKKLGMYGVTTESIDAIDVLEKLSKEYDIRVCFHNHPRPTALWNPETIWNAVKDRHENLGFCADTGHWATSGLEPLATIKKYASRVRSIHMKDRGSANKWTHDRPFGTGVLNLTGILDEVSKYGFDGNVTVEYEYEWDDNVAAIAQCVGFLRGYQKTRQA